MSVEVGDVAGLECLGGPFDCGIPLGSLGGGILPVDGVDCAGADHVPPVYDRLPVVIVAAYGDDISLNVAVGDGQALRVRCRVLLRRIIIVIVIAERGKRDLAVC